MAQIIDKAFNECPLVTILISVYNGESFIAQCLRSVMSQTYVNLEIIVIDDCSTDDTPLVLKAINDDRLRVLTNETNVGLTASLNEGLLYAKGSYIARLDADDLCCVDRIEKQVDYFRKYSDTVLLGTKAEYINREGDVINLSNNFKPCTSWAIRFWLCFDNPFIHSSVMFKRDILIEEIQGYNSEFRTNQDLELWSRIVTKYPNQCINMDVPLIKYRVTLESISNHYTFQAKELVQNVCLRNAKNFGMPDTLALRLIEVTLHGTLSSGKIIWPLFNFLMTKYGVSRDIASSNNFREILITVSQALFLFFLKIKEKSGRNRFDFLITALLINPTLFYMMIVRSWKKLKKSVI